MRKGITETAYLAAEGFETQLETELGDVLWRHGRLFLVAGPPRPAAWAANVWQEPRRIAFASIGEAARALRAMQRNWAGYQVHHFRRAALIQEKLPHVSARPLSFPEPAPAAALGSWTLLSPNEILASPSCSSPFQNGEAHFVENHTDPPSRAYLKLWEILTLLGQKPGPGDTCLDLGASPGGWTWVLQSLGARVIAVDKAPLDPKVAALPNVEYLDASAFALDPATVRTDPTWSAKAALHGPGAAAEADGERARSDRPSRSDATVTEGARTKAARCPVDAPVDWLFSDVVCYPRRLLGLVRRWLESGRAARFVCTVKFQGATDHDVAREFAALPGARLLHLHHNGHELTWVRV